eukprot:c13179_g5_i2.p1 GENE.c13179_g5_i2~~c13179_g5_i2.p1  ORF type:complete len:346 (-),score=81.83 c13179_g5_i2:281-1318(-)
MLSAGAFLVGVGRRTGASPRPFCGLRNAASLVEVCLKEVEDTAQRATLSFGYTSEEAKTIVEILMYAQMRGNNQGLVKLTGSPPLSKNPNETPIKIVKVMNMAVERCLQKTKDHMFGLVGTFNTSGSNGALGYYGYKIAREGFVGVLCAQSPEYVAPHGSFQPIYGTNPICIAVPGRNGGYVLDMATSSIALFGIVEALTAGKSLEPGLAYDKRGAPTTDPAAALSGAIRSFGGHKGSHLGLMVEMLAGGLCGGAVADKKTANNWGNLVYAIHPELLGDSESFIDRVETIVSRVRNASPLPGVKRIPIPGERGNETARAVLERGTIFLEPRLWAAVQTQAQKYSP